MNLSKILLGTLCVQTLGGISNICQAQDTIQIKSYSEISKYDYTVERQFKENGVWEEPSLFVYDERVYTARNKIDANRIKEICENYVVWGNEPKCNIIPPIKLIKNDQMKNFNTLDNYKDDSNVVIIDYENEDDVIYEMNILAPDTSDEELNRYGKFYSDEYYFKKVKEVKDDILNGTDYNFIPIGFETDIDDVYDKIKHYDKDLYVIEISDCLFLNRGLVKDKELLENLEFMNYVKETLKDKGFSIITLEEFYNKSIDLERYKILLVNDIHQDFQTPATFGGFEDLFNNWVEKTNPSEERQEEVRQNFLDSYNNYIINFTEGELIPLIEKANIDFQIEYDVIQFIRAMMAIKHDDGIIGVRMDEYETDRYGYGDVDPKNAGTWSLLEGIIYVKVDRSLISMANTLVHETTHSMYDYNYLPYAKINDNYVISELYARWAGSKVYLANGTDIEKLPKMNKVALKLDEVTMWPSNETIEEFIDVAADCYKESMLWELGVINLGLENFIDFEFLKKEYPLES
ncbi:hypothetical protein ACFL1H_01470 [Nanoarchaeota archaeon]